MNKQQAIKWCNNFLQFWPKNCKHGTPTGWRWVVSSTPYQRSKYILVNDTGEQIKQDDTDK